MIPLLLNQVLKGRNNKILFYTVFGVFADKYLFLKILNDIENYKIIIKKIG